MPTRNVVITEHQSRMIDELVASGRYQNASEVLREGLRLIEARDARMTSEDRALLAAGLEAMAALNQGGGVRVESQEDLERIIDEAWNRAAAKRSAAAA
jgi:antitoxin ParD1/3/4